MLARLSDYFRSTLSINGSTSESNQNDVPMDVDESNVELFETLLENVYSDEEGMKSNGTLQERIDMLIMAKKYGHSEELQKSIEADLATTLSTTTFCSIYSAAFACSASDLLSKCFEMADSEPTEILKAKGLSKLDMQALNEIVCRESFQPDQSELFTAVKRWIAANKDEDAAMLLSHIRLDWIPITFLVNKVRPSNLFDDNRIVDAVTAFIPTEMANSIPMKIIEVTISFRHKSGITNLSTIYLMDQYPLDTIARVKEQVRLQYKRISLDVQAFPDYFLSLYFGDSRLQDDRTLEYYGIRGGEQLVARCSNDQTASGANE